MILFSKKKFLVFNNEIDLFVVHAPVQSIMFDE